MKQKSRNFQIASFTGISATLARFPIGGLRVPCRAAAEGIPNVIIRRNALRERPHRRSQSRSNNAGKRRTRSWWVAPRSAWRRGRDNVAAVALVDAKVGIGSENDGVGEYFSHAHQARVGKTHRDICVLSHEL